MSDSILETCPKCGQTFEIGYNGTVDGCDTCAGVQRDRDGYAWHKGEKYHIYQGVRTGKYSLTNRPHALR